MVGASKILTVSYGTFSCTLEGFDDSFDTMKAIAEYFRDLAADDRYFGAEPPTPDAEMLQRIAEREVQKRVEARIEDDGIVLRADSGAPSLTSTAPEAPVTAAPVAAPVVAAPAAAAPAPGGDGSSVAAKLARIRAVVDTARATSPVDEEDFGMNAAQSFVPPTDPGEQPIPAETAAPVAEAPAAEEVAETPLEKDAPVAEETAPAFEDTEVEEAEETTDPVAETIAAISLPEDDAEESIVEETAFEAPEQDAEEEMGFLEEEAILNAVAEDADFDAPEVEEAIQEDGTDEELMDLSSVLNQTADDEDTLAGAEATYEDTAEEDDSDLTGGILKLVGDDEDAAETAEDDDALMADVAEDDEFYEDDLDADDAFEAEDTAEDDIEVPLNLLAEDAAEEQDAPTDWDASDLTAAVADEDDADDADEEAQADDDSVGTWQINRRPKSDAAKRALERARARVMKVKRADISDEFEEEDTAAPAALSHALGIVKDEPEAFETEAESEIEDLSEEDEADLLAELAESDIDAEPEAETETAELETSEPEAEPVAEVTDNARAERMKSSNLEDEEVAVSRLLEETNSKLDGPEHRRRRSAIAHLKAAVAATVAERRLKPKTNRDAEAEAEKDAYRQDLAEVVRPVAPNSDDTPPKAEAEAPIEPEAPNAMPPLMLVSEQRVDEIKPKTDGGAVRPRRVTKGNLALQEMHEDELLDNSSDDDGTTPDFASFVESENVEDDNDLLEAAAAYLSLYDEAPFSRPQIMKVATDYSSENGEISREDGLRAFGTLLRLGKIEKVKRGQFTISQSSRFMR